MSVFVLSVAVSFLIYSIPHGLLKLTFKCPFDASLCGVFGYDGYVFMCANWLCFECFE